jgi:hypothetical protein
MIGRAVMVLVMVLIAAKAWGTLTPIKNAMKQYEKQPTDTMQKEFHEIDIDKEVDAILGDYDEKTNKRKKKGVVK